MKNKRGWYTFISILFVLLCLAIFFGPKLIGFRGISKALLTKLSKATGVTITTESMNWTWLPYPSLSMKNARLARAGLIANVPQIKLKPDLWAIIKRGDRIAQVDLVAPTVHITSVDKKLLFPASKAAGTEKTLQNHYLVFPPFSLNIQKGTMVLELSRKWQEKLKRESITVTGINMSFDAIDSKIGFNGHLTPPSAKILNAKGYLDLKDLRYQIDLSVQDLRPHEFILSVLGTSPVTPLESHVNLKINLKGHGSDSLDAEIKGELPCFKVRPAEREILLSCGYADLSIEKRPEEIGLQIKHLEFTDPNLILSGQAKFLNAKDNSSGTWHINLTAQDVDIGMVRHKLLTLWPDNRLVHEVCSIVLGGKARRLGFSLNGPLSYFTSIKHMNISGSVEKAKIHAPEVELTIDEVNGDLEIVKGILTCTNLKGSMGNSYVRSGSLILGLEHDKRFLLDLVLDADLSQLPPILKRLVHNDDFQRELSKFSQVEGRATGHLIVGDELHHLDAIVDITKMEASARFSRIPWPIHITKGQLHVAPKIVSWKGVAAEVGPHIIKNIKGEVTWDNKPYLELSELMGEFATGPLYHMLIGYNSLKKILTLVLKQINGKLSVKQGSFSGILKDPTSWIYEAAISPQNLAFKSPLLSFKCILKNGLVSVTQDKVSIKDIDIIEAGNRIKLSGDLSHRHWQNWRGVLRLTGWADEAIGKWVLSKNWIPDEFFPRLPLYMKDLTIKWDKDLVEVKGALRPKAWEEKHNVYIDLANRPQEFSLKSLSIQGPKKTDALLQMRLEQDHRLKLKWKGSITSEVIEQLLLKNRILDGDLSGDFRVEMDIGQMSTLLAFGELTAHNFKWLWGTKNHKPIPIKEADILGQGDNCILKSLIIQLGDKGILKIEGTLKNEAAPNKAITLALKIDGTDTSLESIYGLIGSGSSEAPSQNQATPSRPIKIQGEIDYTFRSLKVGFDLGKAGKKKNFTLKDLKGTFDLFVSGKRRLTIEKADFCGLNLALRWFFPAPGTTGQGQIRLLTDQFGSDQKNKKDALTFQSLLPCLGIKDSLIMGPITLSLELKGRPGSWVDGHVSLSSKQGKILQLGFLSKVFSVVNLMDLFSGGLPNLFEEGYAYSSLDLEGKVESNHLVLEKVVVYGAGLNLFASGDVNLSDFGLDLTMLVAPLKTVDAIVTKVPLVGKIVGGKNKALITIPVAVKGPIEDPNVTVLPPEQVGQSIIDLVKGTLKLPFTIISPI